MSKIRKLRTKTRPPPRPRTPKNLHHNPSHPPLFRYLFLTRQKENVNSNSLPPHFVHATYAHTRKKVFASHFRNVRMGKWVMLCAPGKKGGEMMEFDPPPSRERRGIADNEKKVFSFLGRMGSGNRAHTVCARVPGKCICLRNFNRTEEGLLFSLKTFSWTSLLPPPAKKSSKSEFSFPLPFPLKTHVLLLFFSPFFTCTHTRIGVKRRRKGECKLGCALGGGLTALFMCRNRSENLFHGANLIHPALRSMRTCLELPTWLFEIWTVRH